MTKDLYIISSVFHLLIAAAVAASRPNNKANWVFIRFNKKRFQDLQPCLLSLVGSEGQVLYLDDSSNSVKQRKKNSEVLLNFAKESHISQVFVGNDRHVEFQFLAHFLKKEIPSLRSIYLDEGLYSYIGRKASGAIAERIVDQALKRLVYGAWWQTPKTIGASDYIDEVWLAYPEQVCSILQSKVRTQLPLEGFESTLFQGFIKCWGGLFDLPINLHKVDFILTITDEKNFAKFPGYEASIRDLVRSLIAEGHKVAVKYHPNANQQDLLRLAVISDQVSILPSGLPFEVLLPLLSSATLIAEFSSTLITSRLLNPKMTVWSVVHTDQHVPLELSRLCEALEIKSMSIDELKRKIKAE
jgi:hypothetical protein